MQPRQPSSRRQQPAAGATAGRSEPHHQRALDGPRAAFEARRAPPRGTHPATRSAAHQSHKIGPNQRRQPGEAASRRAASCRRAYCRHRQRRRAQPKALPEWRHANGPWSLSVNAGRSLPVLTAAHASAAIGRARPPPRPQGLPRARREQRARGRRRGRQWRSRVGSLHTAGAVAERDTGSVALPLARSGPRAASRGCA